MTKTTMAEVIKNNYQGTVTIDWGHGDTTEYPNLDAVVNGFNHEDGDAWWFEDGHLFVYFVD